MGSALPAINTRPPLLLYAPWIYSERSNPAQLRVQGMVPVTTMSDRRGILAGLPASASQGDQIVVNGEYRPGLEQFERFFVGWVEEQEGYLHELLAASREVPPDEPRLRRLISSVLRHYEHYYSNKARSAKRDVTAMFSPSWTSKLEDSLLWVGGWRPSTAFHLLYSKSGIQTETHLETILRGVSAATAPDMGRLSARQLVEVDELQRRTIREEREISERLAERQEGVASVGMVHLSHAVTENTVDPVTATEGVSTAVRTMSDGLEWVLQKADELRLRTLKEIVDILDPIQAVHFLTAAAELHLRVHEWGRQRDDDNAAAAAAAAAEELP